MRREMLGTACLFFVYAPRRARSRRGWSMERGWLLVMGGKGYEIVLRHIRRTNDFIDFSGRMVVSKARRVCKALAGMKNKTDGNSSKYP